MKLQTNESGSIEVRELDLGQSMIFVNESGDTIRIRMWTKSFILDHGEHQYRIQKGKVVEMLIGTNRIDEHD